MVRIPERKFEDDSAVVAALSAGDDDAFAQLLERHTPSLLRVARGYVGSRETAEEVVQETWIAVIKGINRFEGRSSLRTWLFAVMINIAKARGARDGKAFDAEVTAATQGTVDPALFRGAGDAFAGHWNNPNEYPRSFTESPEYALLRRELMAVAQARLDDLPRNQRIVVTLRDLLGFESSEVRELLEISAANQRVLLHRGRAAIRQALESYLEVGP